MAQVSLLTSSRLEPTAGIRPHSTVVLGSLSALPLEYQARLAQLSSFVRLQTQQVLYIIPLQALRIISLQVSRIIALHAYIISRALLLASSCAAKHLLSHAALASQLLTTHASTMFAKTVVDFWQSRRIQKIRAKLFYEFAVFILGCGNAFFLLVFWPGWLFLGGAALALWQLTG